MPHVVVEVEDREKLRSGDDEPHRPYVLTVKRDDYDDREDAGFRRLGSKFPQNPFRNSFSCFNSLASVHKLLLHFLFELWIISSTICSNQKLQKEGTVCVGLINHPFVYHLLLSISAEAPSSTIFHWSKLVRSRRRHQVRRAPLPSPFFYKVLLFCSISSPMGNLNVVPSASLPWCPKRSLWLFQTLFVPPMDRKGTPPPHPRLDRHC
ncbi:hypothetical protein F2Q68_00003896 [Brassica cretica]|uniref:Uncharacterized protein n=1 Tax=Brassica cretica TaxID=69181 RepID=A0A8S9JCV3_BRACR|nr:hypothetical protein F2Q68_00003896 [Brassica cretica]